MPPKKPTSVTDYIDGVHYSHNLTSKMVTVGTGVVSNHERDTFRLKASPSLEDQVKSRPKWQALLAAAAAKGNSAAVAAIASAAATVALEKTTLHDADAAMGDALPVSPPAVPMPASDPNARELAEPPQPDLHGKAHHTPIQASGEPPAKRAAEPLPQSMDAGLSQPPPRNQREMGALRSDWRQASGWHPPQPPPNPGLFRGKPLPQRLGLYCLLCMHEGHTYAGVLPAHVPTGTIVWDCSCGVEVCHLKCDRRGPCPHDDPGPEVRYRTYAEVAAGIGCRCRCCRRQFEKELPLLFDGDIHDDFKEREMLRAALRVAGNPACRLRDVLAMCDACSGSCGVELGFGDSFCGDHEVKAVLAELVDKVVHD